MSQIQWILSHYRSDNLLSPKLSQNCGLFYTKVQKLAWQIPAHKNCKFYGYMYISLLLQPTQRSVSPILTSEFDFSLVCVKIHALLVNHCVLISFSKGQKGFWKLKDIFLGTFQPSLLKKTIVMKCVWNNSTEKSFWNIMQRHWCLKMNLLKRS